MQDIKTIQELTFHANIEVYSFHGKNIILYDDHRSVLNVFFELKKLGLFSNTPNLIFFDKHDDEEFKKLISYANKSVKKTKTYAKYCEFCAFFVNKYWEEIKTLIKVR